jgi:hypothetical protein
MNPSTGWTPPLRQSRPPYDSGNPASTKNPSIYQLPIWKIIANYPRTWRRSCSCACALYSSSKPSQRPLRWFRQPSLAVKNLKAAFRPPLRKMKAAIAQTRSSSPQQLVHLLANSPPLSPMAAGPFGSPCCKAPSSNKPSCLAPPRPKDCRTDSIEFFPQEAPRLYYPHPCIDFHLLHSCRGFLWLFQIQYKVIQLVKHCKGS